MTPVLEKVKQLESYIKISNGQVDPILESTISKLLDRERQRHLDQLGQLRSQVAEFEDRHGIPSDEFYPRFERGDLGDNMDFIEWSATIEMIDRLKCKIASLGAGGEG